MARVRVPELRGAVLVADDHAIFRFGLKELLRRDLRVKTVIEVESFKEVMDAIDDRQIVLAVIDLKMPGLLRPSDLGRIRQRRPDLRVVVLTGSSERADILQALEAGVHGYIIKSEGMESLIERLQYVLGGEIYVPAVLADLSGPAGGEWHSPERQGNAAPALSDRQRQVLEKLVAGLSNKQIARELNLAEGTVKMHIGALFRTLGATNRAHAAALGKRYLE